MKLRIEVSEGLREDEVIIRCGRVNDAVRKLQAYVQELSAPRLTFYKGAQEVYLPLEDVLFFETDGERVFAHTAGDAFWVKHRLYELEAMLPRAFARAAKGIIVNTARVYAITRSLASASQISFSQTHKQVYVSRHYYKALKEKIEEGRV